MIFRIFPMENPPCGESFLFFLQSSANQMKLNENMGQSDAIFFNEFTMGSAIRLGFDEINHGYPLVMTFTVCHGFSMALIEIDGLPFLIAWWIFPWRTVRHNQMVMKWVKETKHLGLAG